MREDGVADGRLGQMLIIAIPTAAIISPASKPMLRHHAFLPRGKVTPDAL
jgi:hypothetical protein